MHKLNSQTSEKNYKATTYKNIQYVLGVFVVAVV